MHQTARICWALLVLTTVCHGVVSTSIAQGNPTADQIIKSLTPSIDPLSPWPVGGHRGIRQAPAGTSSGASGTAAQGPSVSLSLRFPFGSAELTMATIRELDHIGKALNEPALAGFRFRIEGHTDTVGSHEYNKGLSDRRAAAVVDYLADRFQIDRGRLVAVGMGKDGLLIPTPDQTPEPRNRRVSIIDLDQ
jgi:OmpA-OmpF porin, OOP family